MLDASSSLPLEEEEPPRMSYPATENPTLMKTNLANVGTKWSKPKVQALLLVGGGKILRISLRV